MSLYMKKANRWQHLFDVQVRAKEGALMALFCSQHALLSEVGPVCLTKQCYQRYFLIEFCTLSGIFEKYSSKYHLFTS